MALKFLIIILLLAQTTSNRNVNAQGLFRTILIFGDSAVDTGNNNFVTPIISPNRADHPPYGRDFPAHKPTGRFSNGKLVPDFLAETLALKESVPPYLEPRLSDKDLLTGVSFGSGGSGFDDLTSLTSGAISMSKQVEYFRKYIERVKKIVGEKQAKELLKKALVVINAGSNDFVINYYDLPTRRIEYNITGYHDFVLQKLQNFLQEVHELGCRTMIVAGLPPIGCLPIQITTKFKNPKERTCVEGQNADAMSYNQKLQKLIPHIQASLSASQILYADIYSPFSEAYQNPEDHGFKVTDKGCCGTGYIEAGSLCNVFTLTCKNASQYIFWDSVHPAEAFYQYLHDSLLEQIGPQLVGHTKFTASH